jgi:hypothetical protein
LRECACTSLSVPNTVATSPPIVEDPFNVIAKSYKSSTCKVCGVCFGTLIVGFASELYAAEAYAKLGIHRHIATIIFWSIGLVVMFCIGLWFTWMGAVRVWKKNQP